MKSSASEPDLTVQRRLRWKRDGEGGSFLHLYGLFWKFYFKGYDFSVFHDVKKYIVALKPHKMYFKA